MELKIKDVADLLKVSEKTIYRWIKENAIPVYHINHQYRFDKNEIHEWVLANKVKTTVLRAPEKIAETCREDEEEIKPTIHCLLAKGGIFYKIEGDNPEACIRSSLALINFPSDTKKEPVVNRIIERERLMSTAVGGGVAFPHARDPILSRFEDEFISLCMLNVPVDCKAMDEKFVHSMFFIFAANLRRHLEYLTRLSHLCRNHVFTALLERQAARGEILSYIEKKEEFFF